jgi:hypothetical protein
MIQKNIILNFKFNAKIVILTVRKSPYLDGHPRAPLSPCPEHSISFGRANEIHKILKPPEKSLIRAWKHRFDVGLSEEKIV